MIFSGIGILRDCYFYYLQWSSNRYVTDWFVVLLLINQSKFSVRPFQHILN
jgi:hypothetical protein